MLYLNWVEVAPVIFVFRRMRKKKNSRIEGRRITKTDQTGRQVDRQSDKTDSQTERTQIEKTEKTTTTKKKRWRQSDIKTNENVLYIEKCRCQ